ncbi:hypothetical protein D3C76_1404290 [compost metagenome]
MGNGHYRIHIAGVTGQMNHDDRFGPFRDVRFDRGRVEIVRIRKHIGKNGNRILIQNANDCALISDRAGDDFVSSRHAGRPQGDMNGRGSRGGGYAVLYAIHLIELLQELLYLLPIMIEKGILLERLAKLLEFCLSESFA